MRRYLKFLTTSLIACVLTIACVNELDLHQPINESEFYTTLVPRVEGFANQYITKSSYDDDEQTITKLAILVFNEDGTCIHLQESENENGGPITLNKSMLNSPEQSGKLDQATVVMIANIGTNKIVNGDKTIENNWRNLTFSDLENYSFQYEDGQTIITNLKDPNNPFSGFPMIGGASKVNLTSTKQQDPIVVNLKILYAKIKFAISVENGTENEGSGMSFKLHNYSVFNASKQTKLAVPTNQGEPTMTFEEFLLGQKASESPQPATESSATESASYEYNPYNPDNQGKFVSTEGIASVSVGDENPISFTFYVSESRFNHNLDLNGLEGIYPYGWTTSDLEEDVKKGSDDKPNGVKYFYDELAQQYKPLLAQSASGKPAQGLATYVLLNGSYKDYRGESWNVNYKVYLGKDNSQNFQVDRNSCYTNNIVIKGIRNNADTAGRGEVWIDHRVNVKIGGDGNSAADHITITRETLIDSHIEVRPLRVRWDNDEFDLVKLYLPIDSVNNQLVDWIGIERFVDGVNNQDPSIYCYSNVTDSNLVSKSTGKRRYFTDGLIRELQNKEGEFGVQSEVDGTKFIYLHNTQCAWIYFDENNTKSDRTANIKLHFYKPNGKYIEEIYNVKQEGLLSLGDYYVESYEEYLHSYDSEDTYNLSTGPIDYTQQGLSWGLEGEYISQDIVVSAGPRSSWILIQGSVKWYDYFHRQDQPSGDTYYLSTKDEDGDWADATAGTGQIFTDRASYNKDITVKDMGTIPDNAYQYCLSKNKFAVDEDGKVTMKVHWYLPDAYEMRAILNGSGNSSDFDTEANYWSSQPSYTLPGIQNVGFVEEVPESARAVSSSGEISDKPREEKHRIRCIYSPTGVTANMDGRTPDGVGGNYIFVMKGSPVDGYFKYMLPQSKDTTIISDNYENKSLKYPTKQNSSQSDAEFSYIVMTDYNNQQKEGFVVNPLLKVNWNEYTDGILGIINDYYTTIAPNAFPGLSEYETEKHSIYNAYKQTDVKRTDVEIRTENTERKKSQNLSSKLDKPLDYQKNNGDKLIITLSKNLGEYSPVFDYNELISGTTIHSTKYWNLPEYSSREVLLTPDGETISAQGKGDNEQLIITDKDIAKERAFNEAYAKAKRQSLNNLKNSIKSKYPGLKYDEALIRYEPEGLTVNSQNDCITFTEREEGWLVKRKYIKCEITLTASLRGRDSLFVLTSDGKWGDPEEDITTNLPQVKTDELRIYSGNSFTISLSDKYTDSLEITKVRVYYSGSYQISGGSILDGGDATYMRFILDDPEIISLPKSETVEKESWLSQPTETLYLPGMGYSDGNNGGWQEWSGEGRSSVPLTLADYFVTNNVLGNSYTYKYDNDASTGFDKYIVIDKIEVKCTKKPEAGN